MVKPQLKKKKKNMLFHGEDLNISRRVKACFEKKKKSRRVKEFVLEIWKQVC